MAFDSAQELELYKSELLEKPALLMVNKMDTPDAEAKLNRLLEDMENLTGKVRYT